MKLSWNILYIITLIGIYPSKKITLDVRAFNERAIKFYKKAGFKVKEIYKKDTPIGYGEFIRMELNF